MNRWLTKFLDETLEDQTDITDTKPGSAQMSGLSVPLSGILAEKIPSPPVAQPAPVLPARSFVTYLDSTGRLCGGWEEWNTCTVRHCLGVGDDCQVELSSGGMISLRAVRAVGQLNAEGRQMAAWTVREHGYDGNSPARAL